MLSPMGMQISGKIHVIQPAQQVTERFRKREFVLELSENSRFPQFVQFQLTGDRCERIDDFEVGDEVQVEFSLRGREWTSPSGEVKYFNSLDVWNIERASGATSRGDDPPLPQAPPPGSDDDIAF
jgi:hypothetical protein